MTSIDIYIRRQKQNNGSIHLIEEIEQILMNYSLAQKQLTQIWFRIIGEKV